MFYMVGQVIKEETSLSDFVTVRRAAPTGASEKSETELTEESGDEKEHYPGGVRGKSSGRKCGGKGGPRVKSGSHLKGSRRK